MSVYSCERLGRKVHLIDTPGFNDSKRSESDILEEICYWLSAAYGPVDVGSDDKRFLLNGIIYLHPLTEQRWTGASQRSIDFLKGLCGSENYSCISLTTTFWDQTSASRGVEHENQLVHDPSRWGEIVSRVPGRRTFRHDSGYRSAIKILDAVIERDEKHALRIQRELNQPGATLLDTTVGRVAQAAWKRDLARFQNQLDDARNNLQHLHAPDVRSDIDALRRRLSSQEAAIASLTLDQPALMERWTTRNHMDNEQLTGELERCSREIASLQRQLDERSIGIAIYNNDSRSSFGDATPTTEAEKRLIEERQRQRDLLAQRMARMASKSMHAGIAGSLFGAMSVGIALLPFALASCCVM